MSKLTKMTSAVAAAGVGLAMLATPIVAQAKEVHIKVQAVLGTQTTEVKMLRDFMDDVTALTGGEVTFEFFRPALLLASRRPLMPLMPVLLTAALPGRTTGRASIRQPCCSARLLPVPVLVSTTSPSSPGSSLVAARSCMTSSGTRWA